MPPDVAQYSSFLLFLLRKVYRHLSDFFRTFNGIVRHWRRVFLPG
ncbi:hypothetical protein HMPREF9538_02421 [Klebsiella sp. MS 92-3]|nr:hypothetical protein HMPREF9538_02421 [Klebsiella sp. MS 92-3]